MANNPQCYPVNLDWQGTRLDNFCAGVCPGLTRSAAAKLIAAGAVLVNGAAANKKQPVKAGDTVTISLPQQQELTLTPCDIPLNIVYEDSCMLVVNKPRGLVVHPGAGAEQQTLAGALLAKYGYDGLSNINGPLRPGILHRIDKDTSGLLMVAKTNAAHQALAKQIADHSFLRLYRAVATGGFSQTEFDMEDYLARSQANRKKIAVVPQGQGRYAKTHVRVLAQYGPYTQLQLQLFTGRTHQIRVQLASRNHPLAGDVLYGGKSADLSLNGQCLHAMCLGFHHPATGEWMQFSSELPPYFTEYFSKLEMRYGVTNF